MSPAVRSILQRLPFINNMLDSHMEEVISGASVAFVLKVLSAGFAFGFNVALARILGVEDAGVYFMALTVITILGMAARVGMDNSLIRFVASSASVNDWAAVKGATAKGARLVFAASAGATIILFLLAPWLAGSVFSKPEIAGPLRWMSLALVPVAMLNVYSSMLKGLKRVRDSLLVQGVGAWAFPLILLYMSGRRWGINGALAAYVLGSFLTMLIGFMMWRAATPEIKAVTGRFETSALISSGMPLFATSTLNTLINWLPLFFLGVWGTKADAGIFGAASRTAFLISFVLIAVNTIAAPKFAALYHKGDMEALGSIARHSARLMALFASPALLLCLIFPGWVMGIFGRQYTEGGLILAVLAIGQFVNVATGSVGYLLIMTGHERLQLYSTAAVAALSIALYLTLIPAFGITGAAIATGVSVAAQNLLACYLVYRTLGIKTLPLPGLKF